MEVNAVPKPNHKRRSPKRSKRNEFSASVRKQIIERDKVCKGCGGKGEQIHHVKPRSQSGRGVYTNGLLLCNECHRLFHDRPSLIKVWQKIFEDKYGPDYYQDEWDKAW